MSRLHPAKAQKAALLQTNQLLADTVTLVNTKLPQKDTRGELEKLRDEAEARNRKQIHEHLVRSAHLQERAKETGLDAGMLMKLAEIFKGDTYDSAVQSVREQMDGGISFQEAVDSLRKIIHKEKER